MSLGKLIVLYGINNLGKTLQAEKLVDRLISEGKKARYLKYPIYDLAPSGPHINAYLRNGNPYGLSTREVQIVYTLNRTQYQERLLEQLFFGVHVVAEDYTGTGLAWGGLGNLNFLRDINSHLYKEDVAILLDGERFVGSIEQGHNHEEDNIRTASVRQLFSQLAKENNWGVVNANNSPDKVHEDIWTIVKSSHIVV